MAHPGRDDALLRELAQAITKKLGDAELCRCMLTFDPAMATHRLIEALTLDMKQTLKELQVQLATPSRKVPVEGGKRGRKAISFLKWVGSKAGVMDQLIPLVPRSYRTYYEPMAGSGTVFFTLSPERSVLCDLNAELMDCYRVLRDRLPELVSALGEHENSEEHFLVVRAQDPSLLDPVQRAARTIFLNKTCFNGLYRVNSRGLFNVPFGRIWWANICDEKTLARASRQLKGARLLSGDYERALETAGPGDLVYLDPPYLSSGSKSSVFYAYQPRSFGEDEHRRLAEIFRDLDRRGCHLLLSNANNPQVHELYEGFPIQIISTRRQVNCKPGKRKGWQEVIIHNRKDLPS